MFKELVEMAERGDKAFSKISRQEILAATRAFAEERRAEVRVRHDNAASGSDVVSSLSAIADELLIGVFTLALYNVPKRDKLLKRACLTAQGGYGRAQMNPHSDLDIGLLYQGRLDKNIEALNNFLVPLLWDIGYENSYVVRSVKEAVVLAKSDTRVFTSYLECRLLYGSREPFTKLRLAIQDIRPGDTPSTFAELKLRERSESLNELHRDLYHSEPNVKDGAGGLRDYHTGLWLLQTAYGTSSLDDIADRGLISSEERLELAVALDLIWRVRNELHYHAGKCEDRLTLANQQHIAVAFEYTDELTRDTSRFMTDYYGAARKLRRFLRTAARTCQYSDATSLLDTPRPESAEITVEDGEVYAGLTDEHWFDENPARLMTVIWECARRDATISHPTERVIHDKLDLIGDTFRTSDLVRRFFIAICNRPYQAGGALRQAAHSGILGRYLPEFAAVQDVVRYEDFHHFPVDEHTLRALEALTNIPEMEGQIGEMLKESLEHLTEPYILILAILLHDLGKVSGEAHCAEGVRLTHVIGERINLPIEDRERIAFLVEHHLLMSKIAFYRDTDDPDIIVSFAKTMKSVNRLRALFVLTYADMSAVGPNVWNDWKGSLLVKLYLRAEQVLLGRAQTVDDKFWKSRRAEDLLKMLDESFAKAVEDHLKAFGERYLIAFPTDQIVLHMECLREADANGMAIRAVKNNETNMTDLVVCAKDHEGLFSDISGCLASQLVDVERAALFTRPDGMALDCFTVVSASGRGPLTKAQITVVERVLRSVLNKEKDVEEYLNKSRQRIYSLMNVPVHTSTRISFDNDASKTYTVVDVETGDRAGLLHDIARAMTRGGLNIASARIVTDARHVRDSFYVDVNTSKIVDKTHQAEIREALENAIHPRPALAT